MNTMQSTKICILLSLLLCLNGGAHAQRSSSFYEKFISTARNQYTYVSDLIHTLFSIRHGITQHQKEVSRLRKRILQLNRQRKHVSNKILLLLLKQKYPLVAEQAKMQKGSQKFRAYSQEIGKVNWRYWKYESEERNLRQEIESKKSMIASLNKEIALYNWLTFQKKEPSALISSNNEPVNNLGEKLK